MWILLSLLAGLADATRDTLSKRASVSIPRPLITWSYSLCALPYFLPGMLRNIPSELPFEFWALLLFVSSCHVVGGLALVKALQLSDLSLCVPMMAFTPVFLLVVGPLVTGDTASSAGIAGAVLVTVGSYVLYVGVERRDSLAPIRALLSEKGARIMLGLALLWSVTGSIDRIAVRRYDLFFWASAQLTTIAILLTPFMVRARVLSSKKILESVRSLVSIGGSNALSVAAYLFALQLAPVHYVVCLKRSNILFSVVLGHYVFGEQSFGNRLRGALLMLAGVVLISLSR